MASSTLPKHEAPPGSEDLQWFVPADQVESLRAKSGCSQVVPDLLVHLAGLIRAGARASVSGFRVGVAGLTATGNIYCGVNVELPPNQLNTCIHAEQFLVGNMVLHGDSELLHFASDISPCGHCRQFFKELSTSDCLTIWLAPSGRPVLKFSLDDLLPFSFGPSDLGVSSRISSAVDPAGLRLTWAHPDDHHGDGPSLAQWGELCERALLAASQSYSPYSNTQCSVALLTAGGQVYSGFYIENAAYTPSFAPLQAALISLVIAGAEYSHITAVLLAERSGAPSMISHRPVTSTILSSIAPAARFFYRALVATSPAP